jgi:hypothetical protein
MVQWAVHTVTECYMGWHVGLPKAKPGSTYSYIWIKFPFQPYRSQCVSRFRSFTSVSQFSQFLKAIVTRWLHNYHQYTLYRSVDTSRGYNWPVTPPGITSRSLFVFLNELFILLERWWRNESITNMLICFDNELGWRSDTKPSLPLILMSSTHF